MDVIEIDAASNNGVDDVRELIDTVAYPPSVGAEIGRASCRERV